MDIDLNGNTLAGGIFTGDGSGLTGLNASNIASGTIADARLSANVPRLDAANVYIGDQTITGAVTASGAITAGSGFVGSGAGITSISGPNVSVATASDVGVMKPDGSTIIISGGVISAVLDSLDATNLTSGTLPDARLSANVPLLNATNAFVASQSITGALTVSGVITAGAGFSGNGAGITGITGANISVATTSAFGVVKPDGTSIVISGGVISAVATGTVTSIGITVPNWLSVSPSSITTSGTFAISANTANALPAYNGSALTSLSGPNVSIATTSALGVVKPDGTSIAVDGGGVISVVSGVGTSSACVGVRLSLSSTAAVPAIDVTAATSIYCLPYLSDEIPLYSGSAWLTRRIGNSGISLAFPSSLYRLYDVFAYDNSGTAALELDAWDSSQITAAITGVSIASAAVLSTSSTTGFSVGDLVAVGGVVGTAGTDAKMGLNGRVHRITTVSVGVSITIESPTTGLAYTSGGTLYRIPSSRANALTLQNGVLSKGSDTTRRWMGMVMTWSSSGTSVDRGGGSNQEALRLITNFYNRVPRDVMVYDASTSWTCAQTAFRAKNNSIVNSVYALLISASVSDLVNMAVTNMTIASSSNAGSSCIGVNTLLAPAVGPFTFISYGFWQNQQHILKHRASEGLTAYRAIEATDGGSYTFNGTGSAAFSSSAASQNNYCLAMTGTLSQ